MLCAAAEGCNREYLCNIFNGMLENAISPLFLKKQHISNSTKIIKKNFSFNLWYDKECKSLKHVLNNIAKHKKFNTHPGEYNILLRQYKQLIQKKKRPYQQVKLSQLENMRTEDPNAYWKFWKSLKPRNATKVSTLSQFVKYFERQIHPPHVDYFNDDHMNNI